MNMDVQISLQDPVFNYFVSIPRNEFAGSYMCAQLLSCAWLFATLWTVALQAPLSMGFFQARILQWVAISFSRGSSQPRDWTCVSEISCIGRQILYHWATWEALDHVVTLLLIFGANSVLFAIPAKIFFSSVQSLSCIWLFVTPWTTALQASLSITNSCSLFKLMSIESVMPSNHLIPCCPLLLLPSLFSNIRVFSNESGFRIEWPKY